MKVDIIAVGSIKDKNINNLIAEYLKRISKYFDINIVEIKDQADSIPESKAKNLEAKAIFDKLKKKTYIVALDERGKIFNSIEFSEKVYQGLELGESHLTFIIGGSRGLDQSIRDKADMLISFSKLTFTHMLFRVILLEQIFSAAKIKSGESYHK